MIKDEYDISLSKFQATRLCNLHLYKRPKFKLPEGITVERLNSTVVTRRNKILNGDTGIPDEYWSSLVNRAVVTRTSESSANDEYLQSLDQSGASTGAPRDPEQSAAAGED